MKRISFWVAEPQPCLPGLQRSAVISPAGSVAAMPSSSILIAAVGGPPLERRPGAALVVLAWALAAAAAFGAGPPVTYELDLREPHAHRIRVRVIVPEPALTTEIQFPAWNALYQIRDFVRNVEDLRAECDGRPLKLARLDLDTWRTGSEACSRLELHYAVYANEEGPFSSVLNDQHGFMNFALLLFYLPRERDRAAKIRFDLPQRWKLATLLDERGTSDEFTADNYDTLVDSPAEAGEFQEYQYAQGGATYRVVVHGNTRDYSANRLLASLQKITATETALMRDVPFGRYTFILHFTSLGGGGGMEHRNGAAITIPADELRSDWGRLEGTAAHEFFHTWNVKRIRPQNLEPVDYVHGNDTRDLWFSEGVTSTYGELALVRAGLISRQVFYARLAGEIRSLQARPARLSQSVEMAGHEAWLEKYPEYFRPERSISYYTKGAILGFLLDLAIRHATGNRSSLDDVMHRLNEDFARRGSFFTLGNLRAIVAGLAPGFTGVDSFFADYVSGTRELDYDSYLRFAGLRLITVSAERSALGFRATRGFTGPVRVEEVGAGSNAEKAGLKTGDILLKMDRRAISGLPQEQLGGIKPGLKVEFEVERGGQVLVIQYSLEAALETIYRVEEIPGASQEQIRIRGGWLEGKTERQ